MNRKEALLAAAPKFGSGPIENAITAEQDDTGASRDDAIARIVEWYEAELSVIEARGRTGDAEPTALEVLETYRYPRVWAIFAARHDVAFASRKRCCKCAAPIQSPELAKGEPERCADCAD